MNSAKCLSACFSIRRIWHRSGRTRFRTPPRGSQHSSRVFESGNSGRSVAVYRMSTGNTWEVQILSGSIYANVNLRNCKKVLTWFLWCFHPAWCRSSHYTHSTWNLKECCLQKQNVKYSLVTEGQRWENKSIGMPPISDRSVNSDSNTFPSEYQLFDVPASRLRSWTRVLWQCLHAFTHTPLLGLVDRPSALTPS